MNTTVQVNHSALLNWYEHLPVDKYILYLHWHDSYERLKKKLIYLTIKEKCCIWVCKFGELSSLFHFFKSIFLGKTGV